MRLKLDGISPVTTLSFTAFRYTLLLYLHYILIIFFNTCLNFHMTWVATSSFQTTDAQTFTNTTIRPCSLYSISLNFRPGPHH